MLNPLVNWQNAQITCTGQTTVVIQGLDAAQNLRIAVGLCKHTVYKVRPWSMDIRMRDGFAFVGEQELSLITEQSLNLRISHFVLMYF